MRTLDVYPSIQHISSSLFAESNISLNGTVSMPGPIEYHVPLFSNDAMRSIWNATTDPQGWISNLASSMTNVVRQ